MNDHPTLIINAFDFGRSQTANEAIAHAARHGIVTSASLMVRGAAADDAARIARELEQLSVGLHFDAGEWAQRGEEWVTVYERVDPADGDAIVAELAAQLEIFRGLIGRDPTHLDSHQHAHRRPLVDRAMRDLARRLSIPMHGATPEMRHEGIVHRTDDPGIDPRQDLERLIEIIARGSSATTIIDLHPDLPGGDHSPCCMQHPTSLDALCDPSLRAALDTAGVELPASSSRWKRAERR
jgi:chitin disaccharide deacetylase